MNAPLTLSDLPLKAVVFVSEISALKNDNWDWYKTAVVKLETLFGETLDEAIESANLIVSQTISEKKINTLYDDAKILSHQLEIFINTSLELQNYYSGLRKENDVNIARLFHKVAEKFYRVVTEALNQSGPGPVNHLPNDHFYSLEENSQWAKDNGYIKVGVVAYVPITSSEEVFQVMNPDNSMHNLILVNDSNRDEFMSANVKPDSQQSSRVSTSSGENQSSSYDEFESQQSSNAPRSNDPIKTQSRSKSGTKKASPKRKK